MLPTSLPDKDYLLSAALQQTERFLTGEKETPKSPWRRPVLLHLAYTSTDQKLPAMTETTETTAFGPS